MTAILQQGQHTHQRLLRRRCHGRPQVPLSVLLLLTFLICSNLLLQSSPRYHRYYARGLSWNNIGSSSMLSSSQLDRIEFFKTSIGMPFLLLSTTTTSSTTTSSTSSTPTTISSQQDDIMIRQNQIYQIQSQQVRSLISQQVQEDPTLAGKFIRLAFHDAATLEEIPTTTTRRRKQPPDNSSSNRRSSNNVGGGSSDVTITTTTTTTISGPNGSIQYELNDRYENLGLRAPLQIVQQVRNELQLLSLSVEERRIRNNINNNNNVDINVNQPQQQPQQQEENTPAVLLLSLADCIALAGAAAVEASGGPHIPIRLGRQDSNTADERFRKYPIIDATTNTPRSYVNTTLPSPGLDSDGLRFYFHSHHLNDEQWIALCGSHGLGRHITLLNMTKQCLKQNYSVISREALDCLESAPVSLPFVTAAVDRFDKTPLYFEYLLRWNNQQVEMGDVAFIPTDVALVVDPQLRRLVQRYADEIKKKSTTTNNNFDITKSLYYKSFVEGYQILVDTTATTNERY